jgi:hypothetical protein
MDDRWMWLPFATDLKEGKKLMAQCAHGSMTSDRRCPNDATVEVRKPPSHPMGYTGRRRHVWQPLCDEHNDADQHGQRVRSLGPHSDDQPVEPPKDEGGA